MQQTIFDQWLRKKLIYINRVYCNTLPGSLPLGLQVEEAPDESGGRYLYKLSTRSETVLEELSEALQSENITYTSRVEDRKVWYNRWLNNPHKSFTYRMAWLGILFSIVIFILSGAPMRIWEKLTEEEAAVEEVNDKARVFYRGNADYEIDRR